eukprot:1798771-Rhodomonas_salina.1
MLCRGNTAKQVFVIGQGFKLPFETIYSDNGRVMPPNLSQDQRKKAMEVLLWDCVINSVAFDYRQYITVAGGYAASKMHSDTLSNADAFTDVDFFVHTTLEDLPMGLHNKRDPNTLCHLGKVISKRLGVPDREDERNVQSVPFLDSK